MGTDDIYIDYLYSGGCFELSAVVRRWGSFMLAMNLMPPTLIDPGRPLVSPSGSSASSTHCHTFIRDRIIRRTMSTGSTRSRLFTNQDSRVVDRRMGDIFSRSDARVFEQLGSTNKKLLRDRGCIRCPISRRMSRLTIFPR